MTANDRRTTPPDPEGTALERFTSARWAALVERLGLTIDAAAEYDRLERAHGERHRAYHTAVHIDDCLARLDEARDDCDEPDEVEFALWLHDAVYRTRGGNSEEKSAEWAVEMLERGGAPAERVQRVERMILATRHAAEAPFPDAAVLVDIDLSILGRGEDRFDRYEDEVRREYRWVPGPLFRSKRAEMLEGFLGRPNLFATRRFRERYEERARANLERSIARLRGSG